MCLEDQVIAIKFVLLMEQTNLLVDQPVCPKVSSHMDNKKSTERYFRFELLQVKQILAYYTNDNDVEYMY